MSTPVSDDYFLQPCQCVPPECGSKPPLSPEAFDSIPAGSGNEYVPAPYDIVVGSQLISIHWENDVETMTAGDCAARCQESATCLFFWHGTQASASTCRLYKQCSSLVHEGGLEGTLRAMEREKALPCRRR